MKKTHGPSRYRKAAISGASDRIFGDLAWRGIYVLQTDIPGKVACNKCGIVDAKTCRDAHKNLARGK